MKPTIEFKNVSGILFKSIPGFEPDLRTTLLAALILALAGRASAETPPATIDFSNIGAKATAEYHGDAMSVTATADGALLRCGFQRLAGRAMPEGLWLESTESGGGKLRIIASALGREGPSGRNPQFLATIPASGTVSVEDKLVRFTRPGVVEEYSMSVDGVRQDFVIAARPAGAGDLHVELTLSGARAEATGDGIKLTMEKSGRTLVYNRLRVADATGRELTARLEVIAADRLGVSVADAAAAYPVRIDPTFSDADWVTLSPGMPGANSDVNAIVADASGNVYVGGNFTVIGTVQANYVAKWNGSAWSTLGSGMGGSSSSVTALAVNGTDLYAGGSFTSAGGVAATNIAKWNGAAWSALGSGIGGSNAVVRALVASGTNLYVGGQFTTAGGVPASLIAKWDGSAWSAPGGGLTGIVGKYFPTPGVFALATSGTNLYAAGIFTTGGKNIAQWNGSIWSALGSGMDGQVNALAVSGSDLYVGGIFATAGGVAATNIAKWDGSAWSALGSGISGNVWAVAASGTNLYVGGYVDSAGKVVANIAKWNGSTWSALGSGLGASPPYYSSVSALAVSGSDLYAGGSFTRAGGVTANYIAKWDGSVWSALGLGIGGNNPSVSALAVSGSDLYVGGNFIAAGQVAANRIVKWDGSTWSALGSGVDGVMGDSPYPTVRALAVSGTNLYVGGQFTTAGGVSATNIARWNGSTWSALGLGMGLVPPKAPSVSTLVVSGSDLYVGGYFTTAGGVAATNVAKWNGSDWSALGSGIGGYYPSAPVNALVLGDNALYAGGNFTNAGGVATYYIAKWNGNSWSALGSGMNNQVNTLAVSGSNLYAGGYFTNAGGVSAKYIAKWDGSAWSALGSVVGGSVSSLVLIGTDLYAGGSFTNSGAIATRGIAKWDGSVWSGLGSGLSGSDFGIPVSVYSLAAGGSGHLFVGGSFYFAGNNLSPYIAQANLGSAPLILGLPPSQTAEAGSAIDFAARSEGYPALTYELFFNGTELISCSTDGSFLLTHLGYSRSGSYTVVVTNVYGAVTSAPIVLNVIPPVERRAVPMISISGDAGSSFNLDWADTLGPAASWETLATLTLSDSPELFFDAAQPVPSQRFYRTWQLTAPAAAPWLDLSFVPAITLTGTVGDTLRVDCINAIGPTDAWVPLGTVIFTNTSQLYFDITAPGHPGRLWRIVRVR